MKASIRVSTILCSLVLAFGHLSATDTAAAEREDSSKKSSSQKKGRSAKPEVLYPEATRKENAKPGSRFSQKLQKLFAIYDKGNYSEAIDNAEALAGEAKAGPYEKAQAYYIAGNAAMQLDETYERAVTYLKQALEADGLSNNTHYQVMQQVGQLLASDEHYEEALRYLDRLRTETHQETPEMLALRGNVLYRVERFDEAIAALKQAIDLSENVQPTWGQLLMAAYFDGGKLEEAATLAETQAAKSPNDKSAQMNLANIYLQLDKPEKASEVLDRLRAANLLTESKDYELAYRLLASLDDHEKEVIAVINEGMQRGILVPSLEAYNLLAQSYYFSEQVEPAIAAWKKAAPLAKDGEIYLNLGKVLVMETQYDEAKSVLKQALAKGVKKPGDAWMTIARAEYGDEGANRAAVLAAYREAAKYPETKAQAQKQIAQMSR